MLSGTLSIRSTPSATRPSRFPTSGGAPSGAPVEARWASRPPRKAAAPVLPPSIADEVRDRIPSQAFFDAFDATLRRQRPGDPNALRPQDRAVLRALIIHRWCGQPLTIMEIAEKVGRRIHQVRQSLARLEQSGLLPDGGRR